LPYCKENAQEKRLRVTWEPVSPQSGKYNWFKAYAKPMGRGKRSARNAALAPELVWRIKHLIIEEQWSPRQISGVLKKEGVCVSHQCI
jgi:integrase core domain protein